MSIFSERFGYRPPVVELKPEEMPSSLRNGLWDTIRTYFFDGELTVYVPYDKNRLRSDIDLISLRLWFDFFRESLDQRPVYGDDVVKYVKYWFYQASFYDVYDLIEYLAKLEDDPIDITVIERYTRSCNLVLERERSSFRFASTNLVAVSNKIDLSEITSAIEQQQSSAVQEHIRRAAELYSEMPAPDYRNSIKESISAVEAAVSFVTGKRAVGVDKPLQSAINELVVHPAMRVGFEKLYAYTSDEGGVRHSLLEDSREIRQEDARYMLVSCSAFSNYLLARKVRVDSR